MYICTLTAVSRAAPDPEKRRREIVSAAAGLIVEMGLGEVTHRKIAERAGVPLGSTTQYFASLDELLAEAMEELARSADRDIAAMAAEIDAAGDRPRAVARLLHQYLGDPDRARVEAIFYLARLEHPRLRALASKWHEGLVAVLSRYTDATFARSVVFYIDGVVMHTASHGRPVPEEELAEVITRLMADPVPGADRPTASPDA